MTRPLVGVVSRDFVHSSIDPSVHASCMKTMTLWVGG